MRVTSQSYGVRRDAVPFAAFDGPDCNRLAPTQRPRCPTRSPALAAGPPGCPHYAVQPGSCLPLCTDPACGEPSAPIPIRLGCARRVSLPLRALDYSPPCYGLRPQLAKGFLLAGLCSHGGRQARPLPAGSCRAVDAQRMRRPEATLLPAMSDSAQGNSPGRLTGDPSSRAASSSFNREGAESAITPAGARVTRRRHKARGATGSIRPFAREAGESSIPKHNAPAAMSHWGALTSSVSNGRSRIRTYDLTDVNRAL